MRGFSVGRVCLSAVEFGSKPAFDGVRSAFRFCVIESSMVLRDIRRKSTIKGFFLAAAW